MNLSDARAIHSRARAYYKGQQKSDNKVYLSGKELMRAISESMVPAIDADTRRKMERRNLNAAAAWSQGRPPDLTFSEEGEWLEQRNIRYGNCHEMTCLAAHLLDKHYPNTEAYFVEILPPGDHTLIAINAPVPDGYCLRYLGNFHDMILLDVWLNVCCYAHDYIHLVRQKLMKWSSEGKRIALKGRGLCDPNSTSYTNNLFQSELYCASITSRNI